MSLAFLNVSSPRSIASCAVLLASVTFVIRPSSLSKRPDHSAIFFLTYSSFMSKLSTKVSRELRISSALLDASATSCLEVLSFAERQSNCHSFTDIQRQHFKWSNVTVLQKKVSLLFSFLVPAKRIYQDYCTGIVYRIIGIIHQFSRISSIVFTHRTLNN